MMTVLPSPSRQTILSSDTLDASMNHHFLSTSTKSGGLKLLPCLSLVSVLTLTLACDMTRYQDQQKNAPVVAIDSADAVSVAFGSTMASADSDAGAFLFVGGAANTSGAVSYSIQPEEDSDWDPSDTGHCTNRNNSRCVLAARVVGFPEMKDGAGVKHSSCFAEGVGTVSTSETPGVLVRCADYTEFSVTPPSGVDLSTFLSGIAPTGGLRLAAERGVYQPIIAASVPANNDVWIQRNTQALALIAKPASASDSFGSDVAIVGGTRRLLVVGDASTDAAKLWIYDLSAPTDLLGCISGDSQLGMVMTSLKNSGNTEATTLAVASGDTAYVIADFASSSFDTSCSQTIADLQPKSFKCQTSTEVSACPSGSWVQDMIGADVTGDGSEELVIGSSQSSANGRDSSGALFFYQLTGTANQSTMFASAATSQGFVGFSLGRFAQSGRDVVAAGAPGNSKSYLFYCSNLPGAINSTERCSLVKATAP